ncbi:hypothetical protein FQN50_005699 [Emmonsiellopsis sp. PD_5]|nr:hypothetical protein FQN50_005699 [Emmonsiellopsis sp. PD_5]
MALLRVTQLLVLLVFFEAATTLKVPDTNYDVIIVGGGPAGLSAQSGLSRVRRKTLLVDSGAYRNGLTRHMHDVIGNDGTVPSIFRYEARQQISNYTTATMGNGTVTDIISLTSSIFGFPEFAVSISGFQKYSAHPAGPTPPPKDVVYTARRIVLATGMEDILPDTPYISNFWSRGIYWCPWCDGFEHRDQSIGILGNLSDVLDSVHEIATLNHDIIAFTNGTYTPEQQAEAAKKSATWKQELDKYGVKFEDRRIEIINRTMDGSVFGNTENRSEFDAFTVKLAGDNKLIERAAFVTNFPTKQRSDLAYKLKLDMEGVKIVNDFDGMNTSFPGIYAVGDCNNDDSTNVPHAMFSGKRAAVDIHVALEKENSTAMVSPIPDKRAVPLSIRELQKNAEREIGDDFETLWAKARLSP